jgi:hypothetical protein
LKEIYEMDFYSLKRMDSLDLEIVIGKKFQEEAMERARK